MSDEEKKLLDKAALDAFKALIARDSATLVKICAAAAWEAAGEFVRIQDKPV